MLKTKDEALSAFKKIKVSAEMEVDLKMKALRTDRGGEFTSKEFSKYCEGLEIKRFLTTPYSPQQNGVVERRNQTIMAMATTLLKSKNVPGTFWGEAVLTPVYLLNRAPTWSVVRKTPYEARYHKKLRVQHLSTFGCVPHLRTVNTYLKKLVDRSTPMVFFGYEPASKAYRVYDPKTRKLHVRQDVIFDKEK